MGEVPPTRTPDIQLFCDVFNASPIGIAVENLDGQPLFVNSAFCAFLGFSEDELRSKHCVDFSPPEDAEKDWMLFQQLRAGAIDHYQMEKRYFRRDGSLVWGSLSISLLNSRPSPLVLATVEDITDKKTAEEARFRLAAIVESSEDAIVSGTLDGIIVSWNAGAERIYGYAEAEAVGKPIGILLPPELSDEETKILEILRAGGRIDHFETTRVTKTGKRINVSLSISAIKDSSGGTVGISGIARDITEHKLAEESMRQMNHALEEKTALLQSREELLRVFVKSVPAAVAMLDRDLRYLQVSDRWCSDNGVEASELLGRLRYEVGPEMPERWKRVFVWMGKPPIRSGSPR
jgi:PAS domain S-box-containing protein